MSDAQPTRRPYHGSCHCGHTKYIVYLTLPPQMVHPDPPEDKTTRFRKCNCTTCHKMGFFHVLVPHASSDFVLLSPTDPFHDGLTDYQCFTRYAHWFFCHHCGIRCIVVGYEGERSVGETVEIDLEQWLGKPSQGKKTKVWRCKSEGWNETTDETYFSINGTSLDAGQEGLDLREWHEKGWIAYLDDLEDEPKDRRLREPYPGGMY